MQKRTLVLAALLAFLPAGCGRQTVDGPSDLSRIAGWKGLSPNSAEAFRFVVLSDRTGGHEEGAWETAVAECNRLRPDFVICVGDLIEGFEDDEAELQAQWEAVDAVTRRLEAPFFYCPGNHDVNGQAARRIYTRRHGRDGRTYYSFSYRGCHFIVLDSSALLGGAAQVARAQWEWLKSDLAACGAARRVFVFAHHPLWTFANGKRVLRLLDGGRTTVFCGHTHALSFGREDGIDCFVLGPTATEVFQEDRPAGRFQSYAHVVVDRGKASVSILPLGEVLPHDTVSREAVEF